MNDMDKLGELYEGIKSKMITRLGERPQGRVAAPPINRAPPSIDRPDPTAESDLDNQIMALLGSDDPSKYDQIISIIRQEEV